MYTLAANLTSFSAFPSNLTCDAALTSHTLENQIYMTPVKDMRAIVDCCDGANILIYSDGTACGAACGTSPYNDLYSMNQCAKLAWTLDFFTYTSCNGSTTPGQSCDTPYFLAGVSLNKTLPGSSTGPTGSAANTKAKLGLAVAVMLLSILVV